MPTIQTRTFQATALSLALAVGGASALAQPKTPTQQPTAKAAFHDPQGKPVGTATLTQTPAGVLIDLRMADLPPGTHGFHIHESGDCKGPDFKSAGGHFAPRKQAHGFYAPKGAHAGDMPNQIVQPDGTLTAQVINAGVSLASGGQSSLFDKDGSALVLHAKPDDYRSQPAGDAGDRIACAVIERGQPTQPTAAASAASR